MTIFDVKQWIRLPTYLTQSPLILQTSEGIVADVPQLRVMAKMEDFQVD